MIKTNMLNIYNFIINMNLWIIFKGVAIFLIIMMVKNYMRINNIKIYYLKM